ncbi:MAG: 4-alpha-glucanotransferase [Bacteroidaceae bacterium]|nr:4-alpha-glucanotransferase [Bacteroidaceae bacterium]MBQ8009711.1 4-alpha-glucanotransferase [Bacteroidaceae bacterium]
MRLRFNIEYRTQWGEEVRVVGNMPELGNDNLEQAVALTTADGIKWSADLEVKVSSTKLIRYHYLIGRGKETVREEWHAFPRILHAHNLKGKIYTLIDSWKDLPEQSYLYSSAFTEAWTAHNKRSQGLPTPAKGIVIKAYAPSKSDLRLAICGNQEAFGNWDPTQAMIMSDTYYPEWQVEIDVNKLHFPIEYKFVFVDGKTRELVAWEDNPNRYLADAEQEEKETVVYGDRYAAFNFNEWKGAGVAVPVFSLRSEGSFGVGDFGDLKLMIDWAARTHQKMVQILPIYDTTITKTWTDSYPYNSISIYAIHPMYADLRQMGELHRDKQVTFQKLKEQLNALPQIDYEAVNNAKWKYFKLLFEQDGENTMATKAFATFFMNNRSWLVPYAAFSYLRDKYGTPNFREWPEYTKYDANEIAKLCSPDSKIFPKIAIYYYIQYHLDRQLAEASRHARKQGVVLKGDIPIGISRNSVEAWTEPHYFNLNGQAGAPPDDFSVNGQNWGFPTYNWDVMEKDNYAWWMRRFRKMSEYFDAYRIDHILGFFRIWEMPIHAVHGLLGQFVPSLPMSREEIESFGLKFNEDFFTKPYIHERFLHEIFGERTDYVKQTFLKPSNTYEVYDMKPEFATQRAVEAHFAGKTDPGSVKIREGLYSLISDVLFLRDRQDANRFHPRISVQNDHIYQTLSEADKQAFTNLYNHYYYQRHNEFWREQAMKKLPQLTQCTNMLVCGEDLGMIPDCVPTVMNDLRILSLEIQRMPKELGKDFGDPAAYPYRSVCTISTHDMSTLRGWWEEDPQTTQRYYNNMMHKTGFAPATATPQICEEILNAHLQGKSMLCVPSLQDWLSIDGEIRVPDGQDERINIPAIVKHYWRYRMHLTLESLLANDKFNDRIVKLITDSGRD